MGFQQIVTEASEVMVPLRKSSLKLKIGNGGYNLNCSLGVHTMIWMRGINGKLYFLLHFDDFGTTISLNDEFGGTTEARATTRETLDNAVTSALMNEIHEELGLKNDTLKNVTNTSQLRNKFECERGTRQKYDCATP